MNPHFKKAIEALVDTANALIEANKSMIVANEAIKRSADAMLEANSEHEDLRETVERLQSMIMELINRDKRSQ